MALPLEKLKEILVNGGQINETSFDDITAAAIKKMNFLKLL